MQVYIMVFEDNLVELVDAISFTSSEIAEEVKENYQKMWSERKIAIRILPVDNRTKGE